MKLSISLSILLFLIATINFSAADSPTISNITFKAVSLLEQVPYTYPENFDWNIIDGYPPCTHKIINQTTLVEKINSAINKSKLEVVNSNFTNRWDDGVCQNNISIIVLKNPNLQITYDGTWLIVERDIDKLMNLSEASHERGKFDNDLNIAYTDFFVNLLPARYELVISEFMSIHFSNDTLQKPKEINKTYPGGDVCWPTELTAIAPYSHSVIFYNSRTINPQRDIINQVNQKICLFDTYYGSDFDREFRNYVNNLDLVRSNENEYSFNEFNDEIWSYTKNIKNSHYALENEYNRALQDGNEIVLYNFLNNPSFKNEIDKLKKEETKKENYAKLLNKTLEDNNYLLTQNVTKLLLQSYYIRYSLLNTRAKQDIDTLEQDYQAKMGDARSRYLLIQLTNQTRILHNQIKDSSEQFQATLGIAKDSLNISIISLIIAFVSLWYTWKSYQSSKKSNDELTDEIRNLPKNIKDTLGPQKSCLVDLICRIFKIK